MIVIRDLDYAPAPNETTDFDLRNTGIRGVIIMSQTDSSGGWTMQAQNHAKTRTTMLTQTNGYIGSALYDWVMGFPLLCDNLSISNGANVARWRITFVNEPIRPFGRFPFFVASAALTHATATSVGASAACGQLVQSMTLFARMAVASRFSILCSNIGGETEVGLVTLAAGGAPNGIASPRVHVTGNVRAKAYNDDAITDSTYGIELWASLEPPA